MIQDMTRLLQQRQQIQAQQNQATKPPTNYAPTSFMVDRKAIARKVYWWAHQDLNLEPTDSPSTNKNEWFQRFPSRFDSRNRRSWAWLLQSLLQSWALNVR
jgi:hypothetical protein